MKRTLIILALVGIAAAAQAQQEPDYSGWTALLRKYYDPAKGMDYAGLQARDARTLQALRNGLAKVNVAALNRKQQLAYWINVYNVNTVATIVENYPVQSIRDISTDPIIRLNVFKKDRVPFGGGKLSLNAVENDKIREGFHDPRIHFAINCAARSCPPIRPEAFTGARVDAQLDDQARKFLSSVRISGKTAHVTKIMDWFGDDFDQWGGGKSAFLRRYLSADKQRLLDQAGSDLDFSYDDYDWSLNDWKR
ncbi:MAG TPA: DUF547 domain-containing protein [Thermoanaerobaculia bacterium]|nr:DUF547 domain-containing protein [Thermoanaerobaculia bacterium]